MAEIERRRLVTATQHPMNVNPRRRRQVIGVATHNALTTLIGAVHPAVPTRSDLEAAVNPLWRGYPIGAVGGARADCYGGVAQYVSHCWPPATWQLIGVEADDQDPGRPDLWWLTGERIVVADELKTGTAVTARVAAQVRAQLAAGPFRWPDFAGVRVVTVGDIDRSMWFPATGTPMRLTETGMWFA